MTTASTVPATDGGVADALDAAMTSGGESVGALSHRAPVLLVFLRHFGCTFCREALADLRDAKAEIDAAGAQLVLVHMTEDRAQADAFFARYGLDGALHVSDPGQSLYRAMSLKRGSLTQLFGPRVFVRGVDAFLHGHGVGRLVGDGFQMPGVFLIQDGRVVREFRHTSAGERPDYADLSVCPVA